MLSLAKSNPEYGFSLITSHLIGVHFGVASDTTSATTRQGQSFGVWYAGYWRAIASNDLGTWVKVDTGEELSI